MAGRPAHDVRPAPPPESARKAERSRPAWRPVWSLPAAMRTLRAVLVIPPLFALTYEGLGGGISAMKPAAGVKYLLSIA